MSRQNTIAFAPGISVALDFARFTLALCVTPATSAFKRWLQNAMRAAWVSLRGTASTQPI
jgi:hypothetical protein